MTELALEKGDIVVATLRRPEAIYTPKQLLVLKLDVTKPAEVTAAFDEAVKAYRRIAIVYNNAGYSILGEFEATTEQIARAVFDVNFFGAVNVTKDAVRIFRDMSSGVVYFDPAAVSFYAATKSALKSVSDALAVELDPEWNIKISEVEAGAFSTNALQAMVRTADHPAYTNPALGANQHKTFLAGSSFPPETPPVSAAVEDPPRHLPLGNDAVQPAQSKSAELLENAQKVASWSESLVA
ncbi:hypothetical protein C8Q72DRAFT_877475 [Fomitopsis betulina]|nr:hypothetical protein C8Q72DRAFT_877475 [Fomitopsis betulina]